MIKKENVKSIIIAILILSQIYLFYKIFTLNKFDTLIVKNIEFRNDKNIKMCEIVEGNKIIFYNFQGNKILEFGQIGYKRGGGIKLYNTDGTLATFIDNRIINSYSTDSTLSSSLGRDMENNGFIALFDSTGKVYYLNKKQSLANE